MLYNHWSAILSKFTINSYKLTKIHINLEKKLEYVDGREQSDLTSTLHTATTNSWWKEAKQPDFNTIYCYYRRKGAKQPDFNTIYYYHRKLMERSKVT